MVQDTRTNNKELLVANDLQRREVICGWLRSQRMKVIHEPSHVPLHPHSILTTPWEKISVDLVGLLPMSNGHDMVMAVVDWLTKAMVTIPTTSTITMDEVARLFQNNMWN
jgi:hypothetical protein